MEDSSRENQSILNEIQHMPEVPRQRISHHRRARSDTFFTNESFEDLLLFNPSDIDFSSLDFLNAPTPPQETSSYSPLLPPLDLPKPNRHVRSFSVDSDFFDELDATEEQFSGKLSSGGGHHRSNSIDGATSSNSKKNMGMDSDKLAELARNDPKKAKRILANRQSAARSKERKIKYTGELEKKVQTLQNEATTLSAQVTMLQRGTSDLNTENKHLKLRLQALEQQAELRNALNEALREELNRLKIAAGEIPRGNGNAYNHTQFPSQQPTMHQFGNNKSQQMCTNFMDLTKRG